MHYYQHNIGDYLRDTAHLSVIEHGIYRLLLDWCYLNESPITTDKALRLGRGYPEETQTVLSEFFVHQDGAWHHARVTKEVTDYRLKSEKNRQNGAKGGRPRAAGNPVGYQPDANRNPNQEPLTINQEKKEHPPTPRKRGVSVQRPADMPAKPWDDWLRVRKAPLTETAWQGIQREAERAGITPADAVRICAENSWRGFKADWLKPKERASPERPNFIARLKEHLDKNEVIDV